MLDLRTGPAAAGGHKPIRRRARGGMFSRLGLAALDEISSGPPGTIRSRVAPCS